MNQGWWIAGIAMACPGPSSIGIAIERTHSDDGCRDHFRLDLLGVLKVCALAHLHTNNINHN